MKDYNCDGIEDIFTYNGIGNIMVYTGYYNNDTLKYKLQQDGVYYNGISGAINVYCSEVIKPAIADFNNDGGFGTSSLLMYFTIDLFITKINKKNYRLVVIVCF